MVRRRRPPRRRGRLITRHGINGPNIRRRRRRSGALQNVSQGVQNVGQVVGSVAGLLGALKGKKKKPPPPAKAAPRARLNAAKPARPGRHPPRRGTRTHPARGRPVTARGRAAAPAPRVPTLAVARFAVMTTNFGRTILAPVRGPAYRTGSSGTAAPLYGAGRRTPRRRGPATGFNRPPRLRAQRITSRATRH